MGLVSARCLQPSRAGDTATGFRAASVATGDGKCHTCTNDSIFAVSDGAGSLGTRPHATSDTCARSYGCTTAGTPATVDCVTTARPLDWMTASTCTSFSDGSAKVT